MEMGVFSSCEMLRGNSKVPRPYLGARKKKSFISSLQELFAQMNCQNVKYHNCGLPNVAEPTRTDKNITSLSGQVPA